MTQSSRIWSLLLCFSLWGCTQPSLSPVASPPTSTVPETTEKPVISNNTPPSEVIEAVGQAVSSLSGIDPNQLQIQQSSPKTWPDGCLGLPKPDELCTQALVQGWQITVTNGQKTWVYRTDGQGRVIRLESQS
ncbi:hypothetical protein PCC8801_2117 [Rippkaea orientalis PCC 8801]|uniref:Lipoprotein n=1 Tax=Rippkaea orientalis (strain PCC 8801 / RF-1) TaxID=41431 RepID=B7K002_RIPO1|nr:hypothetical protein [Rippkaea orientalis]ACK66149.1 hypothetical protein PCC8801_2117 [Rippkaea orientalis PCC 8801]